MRGETVPAVHSLSMEVIAALVYITLVAGAGGYLLFFRLVRHVGATETTLVAYIEPLSATLVSVALFDQPIASATIVGFLAIAGGFTLVSRDTMRRAVDEIRPTETVSSAQQSRDR